MDIFPQNKTRIPAYPVLTAAMAAMLAMPAAATDNQGTPDTTPGPATQSKANPDKSQRMPGKAPVTKRTPPAGKASPKQPRQQDAKPLPPQPLSGIPLPPKR